MKLCTKVLVVGSGPAGATAAKVLGESGIDVILLERHFSFIKPCGGGVSMNTFDEFNIPKTAIKKEVKGIRLVSPKGESLDIELKGGRLAIVERGEFDTLLRKEAEKRGVKSIQGEFIGFSHDKKYQVEAIIREEKSEIAAEYVIAADGVNSKVRTASGIKPLPSLFVISEHIKGLQSDICEFWFGSSHAYHSYSWFFPARDGISAGTGSLKPKELTTELRILFNRFKERKGIFGQGKTRIYKIPIWQGKLFYKNKILFAGDSAGQVLPFTYEGIYYAMKAGELAARAIIEEKVENYKKVWKARFQKRFIFMNKLNNYFLRDDTTSEKIVSLHKRPEIQEASMRLWLCKDSNREVLVNYINLFRKFLHWA